MELIAVTGKAYAGKDTIGNYLRRMHNFERYPIAGPLKAMVDVGLGLAEADFQTTEQKEAIIPDYGVSYRHITQTIGTDWGRNLINQNIWVLAAKRRFAYMEAEGIPVVITDCRFENEATMVRELGGTLIHVFRSGAAEAKAHVSEAGVAIAATDFVVNNNGSIEELEQQVEVILRSVRGRR